MTKTGIWKLALAIVALLAGFAVPVSAQPPPFQCVANAGVAPLVRGEGFTEQVGDFTMSCIGGVPTAQGAVVPIPRASRRTAPFASPTCARMPSSLASAPRL